MSFTLQDILLYAGFALVVVALVLAGITLRYFFSQHIRDVLDDLSGKGRQRGMAASNAGRVSRRSHSAPVAGMPTTDADEQGVRHVADAVHQTSEDDVDTDIDTHLKRVADVSSDVNNYMRDVNDDTPTEVERIHRYHSQVETPMRLGEDDTPTAVEDPEAELPTEVENHGMADLPREAAATGASASARFSVTKSIVIIQTNEVITVG